MWVTCDSILRFFCGCRYPRRPRDSNWSSISGDSKPWGLCHVGGHLQDQEESPQIQWQVGRLRSIKLGIASIFWHKSYYNERAWSGKYQEPYDRAFYLWLRCLSQYPWLFYLVHDSYTYILTLGQVQHIETYVDGLYLQSVLASQLINLFKLLMWLVTSNVTNLVHSVYQIIL